MIKAFVILHKETGEQWCGGSQSKGVFISSGGAKSCYNRAQKDRIRYYNKETLVLFDQQDDYVIVDVGRHIATKK